jgi:hypothetical protein
LDFALKMRVTDLSLDIEKFVLDAFVARSLWAIKGNGRK